jgi:acetylornithine deacetylase/succinyl-diaminopimelate desuccinylase-like protein
MSDLSPVLAHLDNDRDQALERLFALLRFKSISTDPAFDDECQAAARWLAEDLAGIGFDARVAPTEGHPMVVAHDLSTDGPHLLFYGHYDVQPVDPLELWDGDPFEPRVVTREDGTKYLFGRGASDDKGQLMTFVEACRALRAAHGRLPCKITILLEGEEESGGKSLPPFLEANRAELTADIALICDTGMWDASTPAITTMLRGNCADQVTIHGASRDLHSGMYGSAAANPIHVLTRILAEMHDDSGRITIPGFYDGVPEISGDLKSQWDKLDFDARDFLGEVGLGVPAGETAYSTLEQIWSRPTAEVNGIWGGYIGAGFKTVIPAEAHAKVSFRLVGDQDPDTIQAAFRQFITDRLPTDCTAEFLARGGGRATVMPLEDPIARPNSWPVAVAGQP